MEGLFRSLIFLTTIVVSSAQASAADAYLVKFKGGTSSAIANLLIERSGFKLSRYFSGIDVYSIVIVDNSVFNNQIASFLDNTVYFERDAQVHTLLLPNDPQYPDQKETQRTSIESAWDISTGSKDVVVAISDTGYSFKHPDLKTQVWTNQAEIEGNGIDDDGDGFVDDIHGWNFVENDNDPVDFNRHGTHVAGIIGAQGNDGIGIAGINWQVSLMPVRFLDANGSGSTSGAIGTILYAADHGARIINASWGGGDFSQSLVDAIAYAKNRGVLFVAAAANDNKDTDQNPLYPAGYDVANIISVASSESHGKLSSFSNFGMTSVDLVAPGSAILSTLPADKWGRLSGTSMATPMVAGIGALILSKAPSLNVIELRNAILNAVDERTTYKGKIATQGDVNARRALDQLSSAAGFQVWPERITLKKGASFQFTAYGAASGAVSWSVAPGGIATIDQSGNIVANADGAFTVTAKESGGRASSTKWVRVGPPPTNGGGGCEKPSANGSGTNSLPEAAGAALSFGLPLFVAGVARKRKRIL